MAFKPERISELDPLALLALDDFFLVVDVSDTAAGTTKKSSLQNLLDSITAAGLNASVINAGTINDARISNNITKQGNTFNGASQLVQLNASTQLPALNGVNLTTLNASNIASGTLADARLSANVTIQGNTFNIPNKLVQLDGSGLLAALNGSQLTNLNASNISSGTLPDARLSTNVMFKTKTVTTISTSGTTILTNALTDYWFVTTHTTGNAIFSLSDAPANTPGNYFRILANSNQNVHILAGPSTTIYYFMGTVNPGSSFTPAAQRGRVIDLYCVANNTFIMTGDLM
jgi:hypothetical protein